MTDARKRQPGIGRRQALFGGVAGTMALATPALSQGLKQWRMVTSWPKNSPGPGTSAQRVADRIGAMSDGRLTVKLYAAGEIVPALEVFDAVAGGTAEMAHTAAVYWQGKMPAAAFFTTVPFGLESREHMAWIYHGGGQDLWDRLYEPFGVRGFMAGNTGMQMGGWFTKEINSLDDIKGLKIRIVGHGAEIMRRLGAVPQLLPAGEIFTSLRSGLVEGAEFLGPWIDEAFGFYKAAPNYYWPGYNKPNGTGECIVSRAAFDGLSDDLKSVVRNACAAEHAEALAEADWRNAAALDRLERERGVALKPMPDDVVAACRDLAGDVIADAVEDGAIGTDILNAYREAIRVGQRWTEVGVSAFIGARGA